jgi:hypothetical protein
MRIYSTLIAPGADSDVKYIEQAWSGYTRLLSKDRSFAPSLKDDAVLSGPMQSCQYVMPRPAKPVNTVVELYRDVPA